MSSDEVAIKVEALYKCYEIYNRPTDRLREFIYPRLSRLFGNNAKSYFHEFWALKDITFEVKKGETLGIVGRNGSGKSTLLQIICGTMSPLKGSIKVNGRVAALLELGSGFNPEFTGRENIFLNAAILGLCNEDIKSRFSAICDFADIGDFIEQPIKTYSSGMLVRLAFAIIAHVDADILIIDEALAVGDIFFTQKCIRFLRNYMEKNTVLYVSHDIASVKNLCHRALWLDEGVIIASGNPNIVCDAYIESNNVIINDSNAIKKMNDSEKFSREYAGDIKNKIHDHDLSALKNSRSYGKGGAKIYDVQLMNNSGKSLASVKGGEAVVISVTIKALSLLSSPIVGFFVKDRLGQTLFGDNTYLLYKENIKKVSNNEVIKAHFHFNMPILMAGEYTITVAVADGTQEEHVQHHWIHDAISFTSTSSSVSTGIVGIPMNKISMEILG